jgi:arginine/lysine/histidine transporter system substrate-binding protein
MKKMLAAILVLMLFCGSAMAQTLYIATNAEYPPFEYVDKDEIVGFDIELGKALAAKMGMDAEVISMEFDAIISTVDANPDYIGLAAITIKEERLLTVNFSDAYFNNGMVVITKTGSKVQDAATLKDAVIGVQTGTTGDYEAEKYTTNVQRFSKVLDAILELAGGKIDAVITDAPVAKAILYSLANSELYVFDAGFAPDMFGIEVNKNNPDLLAKINTALAELIADGTYNTLLAKYFGAAE